MGAEATAAQTGQHGGEYTFRNGQTIPFRVVCPAMPDPVHLISAASSRDRVVACVPEGQSVPKDRWERFLAYIRELDCIHGEPAIVRTCRDESLMLCCPICRRQKTLTLCPPELAKPETERAARERTAKAAGPAH